jgi:hypothetical protein
LQESEGDDSVVDLLFQPEKCFVSKSALQLMKLVHGALKVCLPLHFILLYRSISMDWNDFSSVYSIICSYLQLLLPNNVTCFSVFVIWFHYYNMFLPTLASTKQCNMFFSFCYLISLLQPPWHANIVFHFAVSIALQFSWVMIWFIFIFLLNNQSRMHVCHPQELLKSSSMLPGMSYFCIKLLCQFRFVHVQIIQ